jgi:cell fate (sporulation/competence/biofilm development) regulator YlbF (YheA/YmcA/DUF963 family)
VIEEKARELGRLLGQSEDYKALARAREGLEGVEELDAKFEELQQVAARQSLVAAQANFDKLMLRVQDQIMEGIKKGSESVIITLD